MNKDNEKNIVNKEDLSSIDSLSENDILLTDEEEENEMLFLLSDMEFISLYEKYLINMINKIIEDKYEIKPLFIEKKYNFDEIINEFGDIYKTFLIKEKKRLNKSEEIENKNNSLILYSNKSSNINNLSENIKIEYNETSFSSLKLKDNKKKLNEEINLSSFINSEDKFEIYIKILLTEIVKCFECDNSSYKLLYNINFTNEENIFDIKQKEIEIDFLINNIDNNHFIKIINCLKNNILLMQFRGKKYEINKDENKNIEIILDEFTKHKKFDILGEIGLNAINDENKIKQFIQYSKILNYIQTNANENINDNFINKFCDKTGFCKENEKILFFITDSKFKDIHKILKESKLYKEMIESDKNINFILCYISNGLYEKLILNNFLNKANENEKNKIIMDKIKLSNESIFKSEKFKKLCKKLNELVNKLNNIENNFMKNNNTNMILILDSFKKIILNKSLFLNQDFDEIYKKYNIQVNTIKDNKNLIESKIVVLYFVSNLIIDDEMIEILKNMKIKFTTINLDNNNSSKEINNLKKIHKLDNIYLFISNCLINDENEFTVFINSLIENLNIKQTYYMFLYKPMDSKKIIGYKHNFNINISTNIEQFEKQFNSTKQKIISYYPNLKKIYANKKLFDLFIKIYLKKNKKYVQKKSDTNEIDLIHKINEIYHFILFLEIKDEHSEYFDLSNFKSLFEFINKMINNYITDTDKGYIKHYESVFNEVEKYFLQNDKINKFFNSIKLKMKSFFFDYLKRFVLNNIYNNYVDVIIPILSFKLFEQKIENIMLEKEKDIISD